MVAALTYWDWLYDRNRLLLGSSIGIKIGGSSIILILILTGFTTYIVFEALAKMAVEDPQKDLFAFTQKSFWKLGGF